MNRQLKSSLILMLTAIIWGLAFVAQSKGSAYTGSCTFIGVRFLVASAVMLPAILISDRAARGRGERADSAKNSKGLWRAGIICGVLLFSASLAQQEGITLGTGAGKAGFITAIYIVTVPIINLLLFRKKTSAAIWLGVVLALGGLYLLCMNGAETLLVSDLLVLACAIIFSFQILSVDRFSPRYDAMKLATIQFLTCGVLGTILMIPFDIIPVGFATWSSNLIQPEAWISIAYAAVFSSAVGYTLQIVGQRGLNPAIASLIMSMESAFAVLAGWLILGQRMTPRELAGSALIFVAIIIAQIPAKTKVKEQ